MKSIFSIRIYKHIVYILWRQYIFICIFLNTFKIFSIKKPIIFYGGAIKGDKGGPLVKIKKLEKYFPQSKINFNIIYLLSNNQHLSKTSINIIIRNKIPIILNQNGVYYPGWFNGDWQKENLKLAEIYHLSDYVLWQSNFAKKASNKYLGKRLGPGEILYNAVDTEFFTPRNISKNEKFTFLLTGNIRKKNNYRISIIILAIKEIINVNSNICLNIAGFIEDKDNIFNLIKTLKLKNHIKFLDKYSQKDAPNIYNMADAYITITFQDNCPTAVLEAMSCGLPILYSASGGIPELVDEESGIGLEVKESWTTIKTPAIDQIVNGMKKIIENKNKMSLAARRRVIKNFDIKDWVDKHTKIIQKIYYSQF